MSVLLQPPAATPTPSVPLRKRTSSFSYPVDQPSPSPRPPKSPRMGDSSLRRAETFLLLSDAPATTAPSPSPSTTQAQGTAPTQGPLPYYRTLAYQKDQRMKRKGMFLNSRPVQHQHQPQQHQPALVQTPHQAVRHSLSSAQQQQQQRVSAPVAARSNSGTSAIATSNTSTTAISSTTTSNGLRPLLLSAAASTSTSNATSNSGHRRGPSYPPSTSSYTSYTPKRPRPAPAPRAPTQVILPSISSPNPRTTIITHRTSSPLSPTPHAPLLSSSSSNINVINAARPRPRGKHEPDLLRTAIKIRMASTPEGQRILRLGPRLALMDWEMEVAAEGMCRVDDRYEFEDRETSRPGENGRKQADSHEGEDKVTKVDVNGLSKAGTRWGILEVTRDLERLVADEEMRERMMLDDVEEMMDMALDGDGDVVMGDATGPGSAPTSSPAIILETAALSTTTAIEPTSAATPSPAALSSATSTSSTTTPIPTPTSALTPTPSTPSTPSAPPTPTPSPTTPTITTPTPRVRLPLKRTTSMAVLPPMTMTMSTNTPVLTASWVVVRSSEADWEMVDCAA